MSDLLNGRERRVAGHTERVIAPAGTSWTHSDSRKTRVPRTPWVDYGSTGEESR
jgi:hypothetical protein